MYCVHCTCHESEEQDEIVYGRADAASVASLPFAVTRLVSLPGAAVPSALPPASGSARRTRTAARTRSTCPLDAEALVAMASPIRRSWPRCSPNGPRGWASDTAHGRRRWSAVADRRQVLESSRRSVRGFSNRFSTRKKNLRSPPNGRGLQSYRPAPLSLTWRRRG